MCLLIRTLRVWGEGSFPTAGAVRLATMAATKQDPADVLSVTYSVTCVTIQHIATLLCSLHPLLSHVIPSLLVFASVLTAVRKQTGTSSWGSGTRIQGFWAQSLNCLCGKLWVQPSMLNQYAKLRLLSEEVWAMQPPEREGKLLGEELETF